MSKSFEFQRMAVCLMMLCAIAVGCRDQVPLTIVPIREKVFREEQSLPLDSLEIESIVEFIADGGVHKNDGIHASVEQEPFLRFLQLFTTEANLTYETFKELPALKEFIDTGAPSRDVIDAREKEGPRGIHRLAYRYKDFWFVFMVDTLHVQGVPIRDTERRFSRLIVMQVLDRTETTK